MAAPAGRTAGAALAALAAGTNGGGRAGWRLPAPQGTFAFVVGGCACLPVVVACARFGPPSFGRSVVVRLACSRRLGSHCRPSPIVAVRPRPVPPLCARRLPSPSLPRSYRLACSRLAGHARTTPRRRPQKSLWGSGNRQPPRPPAANAANAANAAPAVRPVCALLALPTQPLPCAPPTLPFVPAANAVCSTAGSTAGSTANNTANSTAKTAATLHLRNVSSTASSTKSSTNSSTKNSTH